MILHGIIFFQYFTTRNLVFSLVNFFIYPGSYIVALITAIAGNVENKISENDEIDYFNVGFHR